MSTLSLQISQSLNLSYLELNLESYPIPTDAVRNKIGGSEKGRNTGLSGGATTTGRIFVTNGHIEKIVEKDNIPPGFYKGRLRSCNPTKAITINGITYPSGKAAAEALNISPAQVTYYRKLQDTGKRPW